LLVALPISLIFWGLFLYTVLVLLPAHPTSFDYGLLVVSGVGGVAAGVLLLLRLLVRERVTLEASQFSIRREFRSIGRTRSFDAAQVRNLRCSPRHVAITSSGVIAFDYGAKTYRFALGIDETQAHDLIQRIEERRSGV
jgi:hypothetical protein